ncbi:hypothetical protein CR513_10352, partial [Mucuna pruriens]
MIVCILRNIPYACGINSTQKSKLEATLLDFAFQSSRSWELCFCCLTSVNCYPLTRFTRWCETSQNPLCCSQLSVIMAEDKVITLGPKEHPNLVSSYRLDDHNYLQWAQYICTILKGCKKLSHIEGNDLLRDDPKFEAWDDDDSLIMT